MLIAQALRSLLTGGFYANQTTHTISKIVKSSQTFVWSSTEVRAGGGPGPAAGAGGAAGGGRHQVSRGLHTPAVSDFHVILFQLRVQRNLRKGDCALNFPWMYVDIV